MTSPVWRALALVLLAAVFLRAGSSPVGMLDSWADWKYGQWIWQHRALPDHDPLSSYSDPKIHGRDGSWLAEVGYYLAVSRGGLEGVSLLHALLETAKAALFLLAVRRATGSVGTAVAATALMEALCWPFFATIRTGTPAEVCWAGLLLACSARVPRWADVLAAAVLVGLWSNLGPTFGFAFALLGGLLVGRFVQEVRARHRLTAAARDPAVRRLALALGLSVAAACCNPYGYAHLYDALGPSGLAVLPARLWPRLIPVDSWESRAMIVSVLLLLVLLRLSPRPLAPAEVLLAAGFVLGAWFDKRVAPWWLMLAPWLLAPHFRATAARFIVSRDVESAPPRGRRLTGGLLAGVAVVLVLLSPAARWAAGHPLPPEQRAGPSPYRLADDLPPAPGRRVFCLPFWWSDYLLWRLPAGDDIYWYSRPEGFMVSPQRKDPGLEPSPAEWRALVDHGRFDTIIVSPGSAESLSAYLAQQPPGEWTVVGDGGPDGRGLVAVRRTDPESNP
jgi:hypothetical protein